MKALLLGATGLVGGHCLRGLLQSPEYDRVDVITRRPIEVESGTPGIAKLKQHVVNFDQLDAADHQNADLFKADHLYSCLGTTLKQAGSKEAFYRVDFTYPIQIARLAAARGAQKLVLVSAVGADPDSRLFYPRVKGEIEGASIQTGIPELHFFRPSFLLGQRQGSRPVEKLALNLLGPLAPLMVGRAKRYRPVEAAAVAHAMIRCGLAEAAKGVFIHENESI